jgi:predicted transport protein
LLNYTKNIFNLTNIINIIEKLFFKPNKTIINLINEELKNNIGFKFLDDVIRMALKNISLNINANANELVIKKQSANKLSIYENNKINGKNQKTDTNYQIEDHLKGGKWIDSLSLYTQFIKYIQDNQLKFNIIPMKRYINLSKNDKSFCQINSLQSGLKIFIDLIINDLSEHEVLKIREVSKIGHLGMGNIEFKLNSLSDFELAFCLLMKSYNKLI